MIKSLPATTPTCPDMLLRKVVQLSPEIPDYHLEDGEKYIFPEELMKACSRLQNGKASELHRTCLKACMMLLSTRRISIPISE